MIESTSKQTKHNQDAQDSFSRALKAAAAVTGKGRRALSTPAAAGVVLASMLVGGCADSNRVEEAEAWALTEGAKSRVDAGPDASADLSPAVTYDASQDLSSPPDQGVVASCDDESLATRWACCVASDFANAGCEVCAHQSLALPQQEACMACGPVLQASQDWPNYELCCAQSIVQYVSEPSQQEIIAACTPWGPPAPPVMGARKLVELLVA